VTFEAKRRCKWRARRIAWCLKYAKFCNAPFEYETCPGYEPIEGHGTAPVERVRRNIRLLRDQILPEETKGSQARVKIGFKRCKLCGEEVEKYYAHHLVVRHGFTSPSYADVITNFETIWLKEEVFPETLRLKPLFDMQDSLIEHKFPHEKSAIIDWIISCPGDIYRNMTHGYPDFAYIMEKWERLSSYAARSPLSKLQAGDWEEIRKQVQDPSYKALRDQYLSNLQRLREETLKMPMDPKRSAVMVESLDMIKALIFWFESLDPYAPPRQQLDRLTDSIAKYFPREFFEEARVQIPPGADMLNIHAKHPSITSMYNITMAPTLELKSRHGPELKQMISEAEGQKREIGVMLCRSPSGVHLSRTCYGRRETVTVADCHDGLSPLGSFHVHPSGVDIFSVPDLELSLRKESLSCLGYTRAGVPMLKCITPKRYYELPSQTRVSIRQSLDEAKRDIETATRLFRENMTSPEAIALSQKAKATLSNVEQLLGACEVEL